MTLMSGKPHNRANKIIRICGAPESEFEWIPNHERLTASQILEASKLGHVNRCSVCGEPSSFSVPLHKFNMTCGKRECITVQRQSTNVTRYGAVNFTSTDVYKKSWKGRHSHPQSIESIEKAKRTMETKYGMNYRSVFTSKAVETKKRRRRDDPNLSSRIRRKAAATMLERYGRTTRVATKDEIERRKATCMKRYGVSDAMKLPDRIAKRTATMVETYGFTSYNQSPSYKRKLKDTNDRKLAEFGKDFTPLYEQGLSDVAIADELSWPKTRAWKVRTDLGLDSNGCSITLPEESVLKCIAENISGVEVITHDRTVIHPKELDIWMPEIKTAIEVNGWFWHSESNKDRLYHYAKWKACREKGVCLIQVSDTQWNDSRAAILGSMLKLRAGIPDEALHASECRVATVSSTVAKPFFEDNHWFGFRPSGSYVSVVSDGRIVGIAAISCPRTEQPPIEITRLAFLKGCSVIGGVEKILSFIKSNNPGRQVISYSDNRLFDDRLFVAAGGHADNTRQRVQYTWVKQGVEVSRRACRKRNLVEVLGCDFDPDEPEIDNMCRCGWVRVFDAGHTKWSFS